MPRWTKNEGESAYPKTPDLNGLGGREASVGGKSSSAKERLVISPLREAIVTIPIIGETPLKVLRFSKKKGDEMIASQEAGQQAKTKRKREAKDFQREYEEAKYLCTVLEGEGRAQKRTTWLGVNASGVRNGCIETCRVAGYVMTRARMGIFCIEDGRDDLDRTPLVRVYGEPCMSVDPVRNANGNIDLRPRVCFDEWKIILRIRFDEGLFSPSDMLSLVVRVGRQNGLGEGRPNGTNGNGTGNGLFLVDADNCTLERLPVIPIVFDGSGKVAKQ